MLIKLLLLLLLLLCIFFFILTKLGIIELLILHNKNKKEWIKYLGNNNLLITHNYIHVGNKENRKFKKAFFNENTEWTLPFGIISPSFYVQINSVPNDVELFNKFNITRHDQFMDIGSGLGLMCFAMRKRYNFGKIIGIELNKKRYDNSIKNLEIMKMDRISILNYSIFDYNIPKSITFAYAFNPFYNDTNNGNKKFEKILNMLEGRKNLILIWRELTLNYKNILKISKIAKAYETGISGGFPYIIIYF